MNAPITKLPEPPTARIRPVSGYQTTDGTIFKLSRDAEEHQNRLDFFAWCQENIGHGGEWSADMVATAIWKSFNVTPRETPDHV